MNLPYSTISPPFTASNEMAEVDRRKDEFLAMLAHELRNPLSDIVNAVQVLEQRDSQDPVAAQMQDVIRRQAGHMKTLIDELSDISRIASGKILLEMGRLDFVAVARNAIADHQHFFEENKLTLVTALPSVPIWVLGDATRLSQVITNLLHNAAKFTDPGGRIEVCVHRQGTSVEFRVRDTGIGMVPSEMAAMFEPYRQSDTNRVRSKGGLGLGLALSQQLMELHSGVIIGASDGLGRGSMFSISLQLARPMAGGRPATTEPAAKLPPHRILIVDDRRDARLVLSVLLKGMGQEVQEAEDGATALNATRSFRPEIVFCDIGLTDMDGYAVASAMRSNPALDGVYLVALTGNGRPEDRDRALEAGFDRHLTKPISRDQLMEVLLGHRAQSLPMPSLIWER